MVKRQTTLGHSKSPNKVSQTLSDFIRARNLRKPALRPNCAQMHQVPFEVLERISYFLDYPNLRRLRMTCRAFHNIFMARYFSVASESHANTKVIIEHSK